MAGKGDGEGEGNILKLENQIAVIKYVMMFTNVLAWMIGASIFALCLWLRFEPGIQEWLQKLNAEVFYNGVYVLIFSAIIVMIVSFLGCISALQESAFTILIDALKMTEVESALHYWEILIPHIQANMSNEAWYSPSRLSKLNDSRL